MRVELLTYNELCVIINHLDDFYRKGSLMMLDVHTQRQIMLSRLAYYKRVIGERSEEYGHFKLMVSIPRTKRALQKIDEGTYFVCDGCGDDIGHARLNVVPAALLCIDCQNSFEGKGKKAV